MAVKQGMPTLALAVIVTTWCGSALASPQSNPCLSGDPVGQVIAASSDVGSGNHAGFIFRQRLEVRQADNRAVGRLLIPLQRGVRLCQGDEVQLQLRSRATISLSGQSAVNLLPGEAFHVKSNLGNSIAAFGTQLSSWLLETIFVDQERRPRSAVARLVKSGLGWDETMLFPSPLSAFTNESSNWTIWLGSLGGKLEVPIKRANPKSIQGDLIDGAGQTVSAALNDTADLIMLDMKDVRPGTYTLRVRKVGSHTLGGTLRIGIDVVAARAPQPAFIQTDEAGLSDKDRNLVVGLWLLCRAPDRQALMAWQFLSKGGDVISRNGFEEAANVIPNARQCGR